MFVRKANGEESPKDGNIAPGLHLARFVKEKKVSDVNKT
jgi:hypothetical protein